MSNISSDNKERFEVIFKTLETTDYIVKQINNVDQLNSVVNDSYLVKLIIKSTELSSIIKNASLYENDVQKLLSQSSEIEAILNLNTTLEECSKNPDRFHEAIASLEMIEQLYKNYGHQAPILESIYKQSRTQKGYFISYLCDRLEHLTDSSGDEVISIVDYLARCGNFSARDLRLKYLQARDNWFDNTCQNQGSFFDNIVKVHCKGLPMIFEEYKTIFDSSDKVMNRKLEELTAKDQEDGAIINSWLLQKASIFISSLEVYLKSINESGTQTPTMIGDTMQKCFELTDWLSSIGFDFSSRLRPLFSKALIEEVRSIIERATVKFESNFVLSVTKSIESLLLPVDDEILRISNMKSEEQIPESISHYPVFKIYFLYIIESLRWLQTTKSIMSPINLCLDTYAALNLSLTRLVKALALVLNSENNSKHPILTRIAISLVTEVLPSLKRHCDGLFPERIILSSVGLSKSEFKAIYSSEPEKLRNFCLDLIQITEPLKGVMPVLVQSIDSF